ncbi:DUF2268 domain-containing putative Zn-dependent protease [Neobacillus sp. FSL H8-0543]|uniref:DUF2268 domain-containing protein n=1 Tax=Neobacillus sp. FSL H8-0543 TaxID=2954672 RepID=UPI00315945B7
MGIIQTNQWLEEEFNRPTKICKKLLPVFQGQEEEEIYQQLLSYGMYKPSRATKGIYESLKKNNVWEKAEQLFHTYKKKWGGPDIPIYIFPIGQKVGFFTRQEKVKGGVSFHDKMFLFLSDKVSVSELEALFVHEYHHVCRLNKQEKGFKEYTLLDSIIIEGLAEYAVLKNCGRKYLADWCTMYTESEMLQLWGKYLQNQLNKKKIEKGHDELLYGGGRVPDLLGYAIGYRIVENYYQEHRYSTILSFKIPAKSYLEADKIFTTKGN